MAGDAAERGIGKGIAVCWALAVFDLVLGAVAALSPGTYAMVMHPELAAPQLDLIRRLGMVWLALSMVAARAAMAPPGRHALWFTVLGVFRLVEVPADVVYATAAQGTDWYGLVILWAAPVINVGAAAFLVHCARLVERAGA